jgi:DNA modification methylase
MGGGQVIICGDSLTILRTLPDESINCCVTSPPYWGLRDYGVAGQLGLEKTPEEYVARMVEVFREVRRVLKSDGTLWLNLGDSYCGSGEGGGGNRKGNEHGQHDSMLGKRPKVSGIKALEIIEHARGRILDSRTTFDDLCSQIKNIRTPILKPKDLCGIPWRVAFALQADGWWLRQDIIWAKPNPMPESVRDRCTKAHEYIFMLSKSARYWYDADAVREESTGGTKGAAASFKRTGSKRGESICPNSPVPTHREGRDDTRYEGPLRNLRSVWPIATRPFPEAHFATFPPEIPERCIKAGCPKGGVVIDPFFGAGTTGLVAARLGREFIGIELNADYCEMAKRRIYGTLGSLMEVSHV